MGSRAALVLACWAVVSGCRVVAPPAESPALRETGQPCAAPTECVSNTCQDRVCCADVCDATERCDLPGTEGTCVPRRLGSPCSAHTQCPLGHCEDGVCCATTCSNRACHSCATPQPGTCTLAEDNNDPRNECGGPCAACFSGLCAPARTLTNPKQDQPDAGCGQGMACNATGTCALATGAACDSDSQCASSWCLAGGCVPGTRERVPLDSANNRAQVAELLDTTLLPDGTLCVLMRVDEYSPFVDQDLGGFRRVRRDLHLQCRLDGVWTGLTLAEFDLTITSAAYLGDRFTHKLDVAATPNGPVLVGSDGASQGLGARVATTSRCDIWARWYGLQGAGLVPGGARCLSDGAPWPTDVTIRWVSAVVDTRNTLWVVAHVEPDGMEGAPWLLECGNGGCRQAKPINVSDSAGYAGQVVIHQGRPLLFHLDQDREALEVVDGVDTARLALGPTTPCEARQNFTNGSYDDDWGGTVLHAVPLNSPSRWAVGVVCLNAVMVTEYDAAARTFAPMVVRDEMRALSAHPFAAPAGFGLVTNNEFGLDVAWQDGAGGWTAVRLDDVDTSNGLGLTLVEASNNRLEVLWERIHNESIDPDPPGGFPYRWRTVDLHHWGSPP